MSNGRTYYGISDFKTINKAFGIKVSQKKEKRYDEQKRKAQRLKFCKCRECGNMMTFVPNTNSLICENIVEKRKKKKTESGEVSYTVTERCGAVNLVSEDYIGFLNYLFDGVSVNQAIIDMEGKKKKEDK